MRSRLWTKKVAVVFHMRSRLWTKEAARVLLVCLFFLTAIFAIVGPLLKFPSGVTSAVLVVIQAATAAIALFMPLSSKDEARRKMQAAMSQYVILQSLKAEPSDKNRVINRMRELAPDACFSHEEIAEYLESADLGERFAALASVQWQWRKDEAYKATRFKCGKKPSEYPGPSDRPSTGYFPQLLKVLFDSWDKFENYHATVAVWSIVASLGPKDKQELSKRVLDQSAVPPGHTCNEWGDFIEYLSKIRGPV
jgi:hypothetical protein